MIDGGQHGATPEIRMLHSGDAIRVYQYRGLSKKNTLTFDSSLDELMTFVLLMTDAAEFFTDSAS